MTHKQGFLTYLNRDAPSIQLVILLVSLLTFTFEGRAQLLEKDSLKLLLESSPSSEDRIKILVALSVAYSGDDPQLSRQYANIVLTDSIHAKPSQLSQVYSQIGWSYYDLYQYDSAAIGFESALRYASGDINNALTLYGRISDCYRRMGDFNNAFSIAFEGLEIAEKHEEFRHIGNLNNKIGELYREQYETDLAVLHLEAAYEGYKKADRERGMLATRVNLALAYKQTDALKALATYESVLWDFNHLFTTWDSARLFSNLANINMDLYRYDEAESYLLSALDFHTRIERPASLAYCYKELGYLYINTSKPNQAIKYASQSFAMAGELGYLALRSQSSKQLADAYASLGQFEVSHQYLSEYLNLRDSILRIEKVELSNELEAKYENAQKEQQILLQEEQLARQKAEINKETVLRNALIGGVILLIAIASIIYRNTRLQVEKNKEISQFANKIQELQSTQSRWFTNIAHELRTPLTLILGPIQNLLSNTDLPEDQRNEAKLAKKYGDHLVNRVNEILEISRLESGKLLLNQQVTPIVRLLKQSIASFESLADQNEISLELNNGDELNLNIDSDKVATIFNNLISNAIKFAPPKSTIYLSLELSEDFVKIAVSDQGVGISTNYLPYIFDRFYQAGNNDQHQFGGSGVGLTLSQELAKLHGGLIEVQSEEQKGSTFKLCLPNSLITTKKVVKKFDSLYEESTLATTRDHNSEGDRNKPKLLLVEDHPDMRTYITELLKADYQIETAINGIDGLAKLNQFEPDIIISDVKMPEMDGLAFAKEIKKNEPYRLTPFIHLTAHANEKDRLTALRTGVDDYLVKPFDQEELRVRIDNLIANSNERNRVIEEQEKSDEPDPQSYDEQQISSLEQIVKKNLSESTFSVEMLAKSSAMSVSSLTRQTKKMTGLTPGQFIREIRLQEAIYLLETRQQKTIAEVVYAVGFEDVSSFSRLFKKRFGKSPSVYIKSSVV